MHFVFNGAIKSLGEKRRIGNAMFVYGYPFQFFIFHLATFSLLFFFQIAQLR